MPPSESQVLPLHSRLAERYRIGRLLGRGGMGEVYEAHDEELSILVALKTIRFPISEDEMALRRLKREVLLARSIGHPNVCRVFDLGRHVDRAGALWFMTMELLAGETLRARLLRRGRLSTDEALPVVNQLVAALGAAHHAGVVHRDFKSENVILTGTADRERVVVTDFGLARSATRAREIDDSGATPPGLMLGTPAYMAPPAADLFALGVVMFEMLTGTMPFGGSTPMEAASRRLFEDAPSPRTLVPDLDPLWESVTLRCLARDPRDRFAAAEDVARALTSRGSGVVGPGIPRFRHFIPAERDAFIGRQDALDRLSESFEDGARLMTLVGPAGIGKTRLALRFGLQSRERWPGGTWFCDLTEARDRDGVVSAVARSLGVLLGKGDSVVQIGHAIAGRGSCFIILDNFEQVVSDAEPTVGAWIDRATEARFLVTSRERLGLKGEEIQLVEPLSDDSAVALFVERARRLQPSLQLNDVDVESIRDVVRMVEGMPLAIELAAARVRIMTTPQLARRMRERFRLLGTAGGGRHATLRAAIDGSWELLRPWEQRAWAQCAVFEGGFTLEAAEAVIELGDFPEAPWAVDIVHSLVDKSLFRTWVPAAPSGSEWVPEARFGMYVSLQEYARDKLDGASARAEAEARHGIWFSRLGEEATVDALDRYGGRARRYALGLELDNILAACRRAVAVGDAGTATATYRTAWTVLEIRGPFRTALELGKEVAAVASTPVHLSSVLTTLGQVHWRSGDMRNARLILERALALHQELGHRRLQGTVLTNLGGVHLHQGLFKEAMGYYDAALAIQREVGDKSGESIVLVNLGTICLHTGRFDDSFKYYDAALMIQRELGDRRSEGATLGNLGSLRLEQGRMVEARGLYENALAIHDEVGNRRETGMVLGNLGQLARETGDADEALSYYERALAIHREVGDRRMEGLFLGSVAGLHAERRQFDDARSLYEQALAIHEETESRREAGEAWGSLGRLYLQRDQLEEARTALSKGETLLRQVGDRIELGKLLCVRVQLECRSGTQETTRACLAEAEVLATEMGAGPESPLGHEVERLRREITPAE